MRVLMKETLTLHKVLSKYLATQAVEVRTRVNIPLGESERLNLEIRLFLCDAFAIVCHVASIRGDKSSLERGVC